MSKQNFKQFEDKDSSMADVTAEASEALQKIKFQEQKRQFDAKIQELANTAAEFCSKYGEEDWRTSLLINFLDLSLQMQDIIEVVTAFNVANEIIFNAIGLMNTSLNMSNGMTMQLAANQVHPWKQRFIIRKAIRTNKNTVKNMLYQMQSSIQMASLTAGMYEDMSVSISKIMNKMNMKKEKAKTKKPQTSISANSGRGMDMVKNIMSKNGQAAPALKPAAPTPSNGDSGLDGVL